MAGAERRDGCARAALLQPRRAWWSRECREGDLRILMRRCRKPGALLAACGLWLQGCYLSLPLQQGAAPTGVRMELVLNDRGRAALSDRLGTAAEKVEGNVLGQDDSSYTMAVFHVRQVNGNSSSWTGERVAGAEAGG